MKKRSTSLLVILLLVISSKSFSQCLTGGSFTASASYTFDVNNQGFSDDFIWSSSGSGELVSTPVSSGPAKVLASPLLYLPLSATTIAWSYDLAGTANVTAYTVEAVYNSGANTVAVCSGGSLITTGGNLIFAAVAPSEIIGKNFQLKITFTSSSSGSKILNVDNFKTNATAITGGGTSTLPVTISYFNGAISSGAVKLTWLVATEINVNRYEIERSSNGKTYSKIGQVAASGVTTYTYSDATATSGSNYYRLKAVDNDGKFKYSAVVLIKLGKNSLASTLKVYPTATTTSVTVEYMAASVNNAIDVISLDGKLLKTVKPAEGSTETSINVSSLKAGFYLLRYSTNGSESASVKFIKQ
jgi:hypothetical protein